jgi:nucleoside phosphorylase
MRTIAKRRKLSNVFGFAPLFATHFVSNPEDDVTLGDVVVSDSTGVIEYDFVKETQEGRAIRSSPQKPSAKLIHVFDYLRSEEILNQRPWEELIAAGQAQLGGNYRRPESVTDILSDGNEIVAHLNNANRREGQSKIHAGGIATADTLQKNPAQRDYLRDHFNVRAIEMEGNGIQSAAWAQGKDIFVIRGICDYCDNHKNDLWQEYAALAAAAYARVLIESMPKEWF